MKRVIIKQHDATDCAAACLASVGAFFHLYWPIEQIRRESGTQKTGTNIKGLIEAARTMGIEATAMRCASEKDRKAFSWASLPVPSMVLIEKENFLLHFVVFYGTAGGKLLIMDPARSALQKIKPDKLDKCWTGVVVSFRPLPQQFKTGDYRIRFGTKAKEIIKDNFKALSGCFAAAVICTLLGFYTAIYIQQLLDRVIPSANGGLLNKLSACLSGAMLLYLILSTVRGFLLVRTSLRIDSRLILDYYKHVIYLPQSFFDQRPVGEIISRINDAFKISAFLSNTLISVILCVIIIACTFVLLFSYYWKLALICFLSVPLYALTYYCFNRLNRKTRRKSMEASAGFESQLVASLQAVTNLKCFAAERYAINKTREKFDKLMATVKQSGYNTIRSGTGTDSISKGLSLALLWMGAAFVFRNELSIGELMSFFTLSAYYSEPISQLIAFNLNYQDARIAASRLFEIMELPAESTGEKCPAEAKTPAEAKAPAEGTSWTETKTPAEAKAPEKAKIPVREVLFKDVTYNYPGRGNLFEGLNWELPIGEISVLQGESGCGKTTIAHLLMRLYECRAGQILFNGTDSRRVDLEQWRSIFSIVPQRIEIIGGSLLDNLVLGSEKPDYDIIKDLCRQTGIDDFINKLPQGLLTPTGEQGIRLSGGQRQQIALVRALYRDPEILILDEATSSLDGKSAKHIKQCIEQFHAKGKTVLIIAHTLRYLPVARYIFNMENGRIKTIK